MHHILNSSSKLLKHLVSDILDFSRIKAKKFNTVLKKFNIKETIEEVVDIQKYQAERLGLKIKTKFHGFDLVNYLVQSDPDRIQQVLLNLLSNALKFTNEGSITIMCKPVFSPETAKWFARISVRDTGVGISPENQAKLFKLFGTLQHSGQQNTNGIGLGLVISRSIVEAYDGIIDFVSEEGKGTKFFFTFQIGDLAMPARVEVPPTLSIRDIEVDLQSQAEEAKEDADASDEEEKVRKYTLQKFEEDHFGDRAQVFEDQKAATRQLRVLVVDDIVFNVDAIYILLLACQLKTDLQVHFAFNGQQAVDQVVAQPDHLQYDLILCDCNMPVMDGYQASIEIRKIIEERGLEQPVIIAVTGHSEDVHVQRAKDSGMDGLIPKPLNYVDIKPIVEENVKKHMQIKQETHRSANTQHTQIYNISSLSDIETHGDRLNDMSLKKLRTDF